MDADEGELIDHALRWKHAAELSVKAGDVKTLCRLLSAGQGRQSENATTTAANLYYRVEPVGLDTLLMELDPLHTTCVPQDTVKWSGIS